MKNRKHMLHDIAFRRFYKKCNHEYMDWKKNFYAQKASFSHPVMKHVSQMAKSPALDEYMLDWALWATGIEGAQNDG